VWDSVLYNYHNSPALPFTKLTWDETGQRVKDLLARHRNFSIDSTLDVLKWATETHKIAPSAYEGAEEKVKLTDEYI